MPLVSRLYLAECWKTLKRPMTWTLGIILVTLIVLIYATLIATILVPDSVGVNVEVDAAIGSGLEESLILPNGLFMGIGLVQLLATALIIVLAAGVVGSDLSWGTVRTMLLMGAGRTRILIAKILTLLTAGLVGIIIGLLLAIAGSIVTGYVVGEGLMASRWITLDFAADAVVLIGRTMVGVAVWALVAATITLVARSLAAGLGAALALLFLGGQIGGLLGQLGQVGVWLGRSLPNAGVDALAQLNSMSPPVYSTGDWIWIVGNVAAWIVALSTVAVIVFRRMDTLAAGSQ